MVEYTVTDDELDEILSTVRSNAENSPDETHRSGMLTAAEHYDRLIRNLNE